MSDISKCLNQEKTLAPDYKEVSDQQCVWPQRVESSESRHLCFTLSPSRDQLDFI